MPAFFGALVFPSRLFRLRGYIKQRTSISFRISYLYLYYFHAQFAESVLILFLILIQFPLCLISSQSFRPLHYWHAFHICFNLMLLEQNISVLFHFLLYILPLLQYNLIFIFLRLHNSDVLRPPFRSHPSQFFSLLPSSSPTLPLTRLTQLSTIKNEASGSSGTLIYIYLLHGSILQTTEMYVNSCFRRLSFASLSREGWNVPPVSLIEKDKQIEEGSRIFIV